MLHAGSILRNSDSDKTDNVIIFNEKLHLYVFDSGVRNLVL